jgi:hypothetical protein
MFCLVCSIFMFCGCESSFSTLTNDEHAYPAGQPADIKVTTNDKLEGKYSEIGYVFANGSSVNSCIENLKQKAAEMGGTSVIKLQTNVIRYYLVILVIPFASDRYYAQGIVVKQ